MNLKQELQFFRRELAKKADPQRAKGAKKYLKSPYKFFGLTAAEQREVLSRWLKDHPDLDIDQVIKMADALWHSPYHEKKNLAVRLLDRYSKKLEYRHLPFLGKMVQEVNNWDHLDDISAHLLGQLIDNDPRTLKRLPVWAKSKNFWVRRSALLCQLPQFRRKAGDKDLFFRLAIPMFDEGDNWDKDERFFIRKAIGWVLREISKKEPDIVFDFVQQYGPRMSGLTFREATRRLPLSMQRQLKKAAPGKNG